mgnify:CR=1 FL=1
MLFRTWTLALGLIGLMETTAVASNSSLYAIRLDVWSPKQRVEPKWGTPYTLGGLKIGPPPPSAVPVTPGGRCPAAPVIAQADCTASFGTGPPGIGPVRNEAPIISSATTGQPPVWVPAYSVLDWHETKTFPSTYHLPGYPVATRYYSIHNQLGIFYASHPEAPLSTYTLHGAETTTRSEGQYDSGRGGTIIMIPGVRRFGGTMRFFSGPMHRFIGLAERPSTGRYADYTWKAVRTLSNHGNPPTRNSRTGPQTVGQTLTYGSTQLEHQTLQTIAGGPIHYQYWGFSTIVPWTTGKVMVRQLNGPNPEQPTSITATGYDHRVRTEQGGITGALSLVQPYLYHSYPEAGGFSTSPPAHLAFIRRLTLTFLPEPGPMILFFSGLLGLAVLYGIRRKLSRP